MLGSHRILIGDVLEQLATLPDASVHCVVTSPPYWGLRDYGTATWEGGDAECDHVTRHGLQGATGQRADRTFTGSQNYYSDTCGKCGARRIDSQIGLEATPDLFVAKMVEVFQAVRRVLRDDGTLWLNLGDSYCNAGSQRNGEGLDGSRRGGATGPDGALGYKQNDKRRTLRASGIKHKDLCGIPWRVAFALQADGWVLRQEIIWQKPNPMPESVTDRCTKAHEQVFMFAKAKWTGPEGTEPIVALKENLIWLGAMIDAEGSICINRKSSGSRQKNQTYAARLCVYNTSAAIVERCVSITGVGKCGRAHNSGGRTVYQWQVTGPRTQPILSAIYPYLTAKQQQASMALELQLSNQHHGNKAGFSNGAKEKPAAVQQRQADIYAGCSELNKTGVTEIRVKPWTAKWTSQPYSYDADAVREAAEYGYSETVGDGFISAGDNGRGRRTVTPGSGGSRNLRSVWSIPTQAYPEAHFATFPEKLVEPCVKAGTSEKGCCPECGAPWVRVVEKEQFQTRPIPKTVRQDGSGKVCSDPGRHVTESRTLGWRPGCECEDVVSTDPITVSRGPHPPIPCTVLDPFCGSGTTLLVACRLGRDAIGIELNPKYAAQAEDRIGKGLRPATHRSDRVEDAPLFTGGNGNG